MEQPMDTGPYVYSQVQPEESLQVTFAATLVQAVHSGEPALGSKELQGGNGESNGRGNINTLRIRNLIQ